MSLHKRTPLQCSKTLDLPSIPRRRSPSQTAEPTDVYREKGVANVPEANAKLPFTNPPRVYKKVKYSARLGNIDL